MVLVGTFTNPRKALPVDGPASEGLTDLDVSVVLKDHPALSGAKKVTIPRLIQQPNVTFLIFFAKEKGSLEPYRAEVVGKDGEIVRYLAGASRVKDGPIVEQLAHCLSYLNGADDIVVADAYQELDTADSKDLAALARTLSPAMLVRCLRDPNTRPACIGIYAELLGHCGQPKHGDLLRWAIEQERHNGSGLDRLLLAYVTLEPKEGWSYMERAFVGNTQAQFVHRYAALRAIRKLWNNETLAKEVLLRGMLALGDSEELADFIIDDLRRWKRWELTDIVVNLANRKTHEHPIIQRAAIRFALQSPTENAAAYINQWRQRDRELVADMEEILSIENEPAPPGGMK